MVNYDSKRSKFALDQVRGWSASFVDVLYVIERMLDGDNDCNGQIFLNLIGFPNQEIRPVSNHDMYSSKNGALLSQGLEMCVARGKGIV